MKPIFFFVLSLFAVNVYSQQRFTVTETYCDRFLNFQGSSNNLALFITKVYSSKDNDSSFTTNNVVFFSSKDGRIAKEIIVNTNDTLITKNITEGTTRREIVTNLKGDTISTFTNGWKLDINKKVTVKAEYVYDFTVSHDGLSFIIFSSPMYDPNNGSYIIKKYTCDNGKLIWEKAWYSNSPPLNLAYTSDDRRIIGVSTKSCVIIDAESGSLIKKSNAISNIGNFDDKYLKFNISKDGKYFAFWRSKYLTWNLEDEGGGKRLLDLTWFGLKWLFSFGSISNYVYVWDVEHDNLFSKIRIPYITVKGTPLFVDDKDLLIDEDCNYKLYSLVNKRFEEEKVIRDSCNPTISYDKYNDTKMISPDKTYLVFADNQNISIYNYATGNLIKRFEQDEYIDLLEYGAGSGTYAMGFSSDSKYFAFVTYDHLDTLHTDFKYFPNQTYTAKRGNKLVLYNTQTWKKVWERTIR